MCRHLLLSSDESDSEGTIYTFSRADTAALRGSSGNDQSETECDRERVARLSRGFPRRPPQRSQAKSDIIDC
ncbi:down syndrome cell adhesion molecule-like protein Dscam2 [Caerostris darwini]|uniref:Down syndrome cell adhesion molecule-like protein Dscam2 n=1 Tax=Caerostris darwini TaxID=1538125 RepID=A0AAV4N639_9ARAC|nr:down syndrome cell adhesion molecule-like protein Dscam2 [Caerostris darwini]